MTKTELDTTDVRIVESLGYLDDEAAEQIVSNKRNNDLAVIKLVEDGQHFLVHWPEGSD